MAGYDRPISEGNVCDVSKIYTVIEFYTFCAWCVLNEHVVPIFLWGFNFEPTKWILMKFGVGNIHSKFKGKFVVCVYQYGIHPTFFEYQI
jgi:hypothetical protein